MKGLMGSVIMYAAKLHCLLYGFYKIKSGKHKEFIKVSGLQLSEIFCRTNPNIEGCGFFQIQPD